jgi:hypothetical protein
MMNSNEKLTKSALEKMLEQGQKSASLLKECFKDLLFKESQKEQDPTNTSTPTLKARQHEDGRSVNELDLKYKKKKKEWKEKIRGLEEESMKQREKIIKLETLLESKESMVGDKEKIIREGYIKEIALMKERLEGQVEEKEKIQVEKTREIKEWKARVVEVEKKNDKLREKILQIDIWGTRNRFSDLRVNESPYGNRSFFGQDQMYSKSTVPKYLTNLKWDVRSQMDDRDIPRNPNRPHPSRNLPGDEEAITYGPYKNKCFKERSKSLFNLGGQRYTKTLENSNFTQKKQNKTNHRTPKFNSERETKRSKELRSYSKRNTLLNENNLELEPNLEKSKYLDLKEISSSRSVGDFVQNSSFENNQLQGNRRNLRTELKKKRRLIKISKLMKVEHCVSFVRKGKKESREYPLISIKDVNNKIESLKDFNQTAELYDTSNFQTFQNSNKVIGSNNFLMNSSKNILQQEQKEETLKFHSKGREEDFTKNVFLNSGLVAEAKELEQDMIKEKVVLINELNSETQKLRDEKVTSSRYIKFSGDLLKFLYCQALCIDTGLDTFEEFMEEERPSEGDQFQTQGDSAQFIDPYEKYPKLSMQAVKEVEEEHEVDTSPRKRLDPIKNMEIQVKSPDFSETSENKEVLKVPLDMQDALLSEKVETENHESLNVGALLSNGNERQTCESEIIQKTKNPVNFENKLNKDFSNSLPNNKITGFEGFSNGERNKMSHTTGLHKKWKSGKDLEYGANAPSFGVQNKLGHEKKDSELIDFPEINIDKHNLEMTLREISKNTRSASNQELIEEANQESVHKKEIGRGIMEEYISGENRRYFINNGIKMRVDEEGIVINQEPLTVRTKLSGEQEHVHPNNLYNQIHSENQSPDLSQTKETSYKKVFEENEVWEEQENSFEEELGNSEDYEPEQQNFIIEDEGNIYMHRHQRQLKERRMLAKEDPLVKGHVQTVDLEQALIPRDFDPESLEGTQSEHESDDEELNIYELSSKHVRSSFGSVQEHPEEVIHTQSSKNVSAKDLKEIISGSLKNFYDEDLVGDSFLRKNKSNKYLEDEYNNSLRKKSKKQLMNDDLFYTMKERNKYPPNPYEKNTKPNFRKNYF